MWLPHWRVKMLSGLWYHTLLCTKISILLRFFYIQEGLGSVLSKLNIASVVNNLILFCFCCLMSIRAPESNFLHCLCIHLCFHPVMVDIIIFLWYGTSCALSFISLITVGNRAHHKKLLSLLFELFGISAWSQRLFGEGKLHNPFAILDHVVFHCTLVFSLNLRKC